MNYSSRVRHARKLVVVAGEGGGRDGERAMVQGRGVDRQQRMIEAAATLLIDEGFDAITHRRVADAAGVPRGSASYYFPTRAGLIATAVRAAEDLRVASATAYAEALPARRRTSRETARELIATAFAPHVDDTVAVARLDPMMVALRDPELAPIMREHRPGILAALGVVLERSGREDVTDIDLLAHLVDAALITAASGPAEGVIDRAADLVGRFLEHY
ncbi:TetR family transcriptional regulator [Aeromicrobium sp. YIM 150415]|uniref:TetR/AcrR family transcriptional regulator n=1 Tax=Aeromicrobium sp. YIM 150415 TaxID=2803912 RepID=UPI00196480C1|nr:TetR family transcriptional regulator [Aeromicrobium sp. YIM 150415]MBM9465483.1 TetR family transcriptional regulator [Aeromicrobium sp. YIM 150415]